MGGQSRTSTAMLFSISWNILGFRLVSGSKIQYSREINGVTFDISRTIYYQRFLFHCLTMKKIDSKSDGKLLRNFPLSIHFSEKSHVLFQFVQGLCGTASRKAKSMHLIVKKASYSTSSHHTAKDESGSKTGALKLLMSCWPS